MQPERRQFLADVGQGMLIASMGSAVARTESYPPKAFLPWTLTMLGSPWLSPSAGSRTP